MELTLEQQNAVDIFCKTVGEAIDESANVITNIFNEIANSLANAFSNMRPLIDWLHRYYIKWSDAPSKWKHYALYGKNARIRQKYVNRIWGIE